MCILIHQPKDYCFSSEQLRDFFYKNSDGFGAIVNHGDERGVKVYKSVGGIKEIEDMYYNDVACYEAIIHFRMKTHGNIDLENCHPYEVLPNVYMAHNGILSYGNTADPTKSDTWHYIKDFIKPMLELTPDALKNPYIRGYLGAHIGSSNKFGFMDLEGNVAIINRHSGVEHDGVWYSNTYAWTPWKFGYGEPPRAYNYGGHTAITTAPPSKSTTGNPYHSASPKTKNHYGSSKSWQLWNDYDEEIAAWEKEGYESPSLADGKKTSANERYQQALAADRRDAKSKSQRNRVQKAKAKKAAAAKKAADEKAAAQVTSLTGHTPWRISHKALVSIIRSSYNVMQRDDYHGIVRWVSENPMKASAILYEMYGDDGPDSKWTSEIISDRVNQDSEWGADAILDMWAENEEALLEIAEIVKPNSSTGVHSHVQ